MRRFIPNDTKIPFDQIVLVPSISYPVSLDAPGWDDPSEALAHGTHVIGVISGAAFSEASDFTPADLAPFKDYFRIVPFSLLEHSQRPTISDPAVKSIIQSASGNGAIVNLSIQDVDNYDQFRSTFDDAPIVIVVAAGNTHFELGGGANEAEVYPAMYGGYTSDHVITVAATTTDGKLAPFSNHSRDYVDIGAPGCAIDSIADAATLSRLELDGTSQASPLVAMTAALLQHFRIQDQSSKTSPHIIKERILSSVDPRPDLDVYAGGTLNVLKAIRFDKDIVTLNQTVDNDFQAGKPIFGEIQKPSMLTPCTDQDTQRLKSLNHIVPQFGSGQSLLSFGSGKGFKIVRCNTNPFEITFAADNGKTLQLKSDQIADIVFMNPAMRPRARCERN